MRLFGFITLSALTLLPTLVFAQAPSIDIAVVKKLLPVEEHRNCSMILRNVRRDINNGSLLMLPKDLAAVKESTRDAILQIDTLEHQRMVVGEMTEARWKALYEKTPKVIWDYSPIESYNKSTSCIEKLDKISKSMIAKPQEKTNTFACSGELRHNLVNNRVPMTCDFAIDQTSSQSVAVRYRQSSNSSSSPCSLDFIKGNDPNNPNNREKDGWSISQFSSREETRRYAMGTALDRSFFEREGNLISFRRYIYQTNNGLNWTIVLQFNSATKELSLQHIYNNGKGLNMINVFSGTCQPKR